MSELYLEILKNSTLNRNTSILIESYLLDPPILPFINELHRTTIGILNETMCVQYYTSYSRESYRDYDEILLGGYKIRCAGRDWYIR
jgi:hypothetical protein